SMIDSQLPYDGGAATLDVGGRLLRVPKLATADFSSFPRTEGHALDGVLGMDFFMKYTVELDYEIGVIRIHDPATFDYHGSGEIVPVTIAKGRPRITATMNGETRDYVIDTASADAINDDSFEGLERAAEFAIGRFRFTGVNAAPGGRKISGELLHRFVVIADFAHARLILEPGRHFGDAFLFDTSGLELELARDGLRIAHVFANTPASDAALLESDIITRIDEQSPLALGIDRVRRMFHEVRTHELLVRRGTKTMTVKLALRKLL
ncbi:MAG TPA: hypothetical protein VN181_05780, partial [Thermoanaerobaculia bacterium]|nr:hypothetical protein [Thermoanaerobaculia bacterium]